MGIKDVRQSPIPYDRLTEIADEMQKVCMTPDREDVRGIIFLEDSERGGVVMFGYNDTSSGMAALLVHMKAVFQSMGKSFGVMTDQGVMIVDTD